MTGEADDAETRTSDSAASHGYDQDRENESVTAETRSEVLARDGHRCQVCGREGPERGGLATLHVHHIERDPVEVAENGLENLTTLCRSCHSWIHQQSTRADAPVTLTEADLSVLLPQDIEILRYLADEGPAQTGKIADSLTAELSPTTVRERLAVLMGLDNQVETRDRQIVDQDVQTGAWGLAGQIEHSARGHIPSDPQALIQRVEDEQVRRALERGCDRQTVMDVLDISRRSTFHKQKRARAYDFPLAAFRRSGDGGQHPAGSTAGERESDPSGADADGQQQLDTVDDETEDARQPDHVVSEESSEQGPVEDGEATLGEDGTELREQLETAITALQRVSAEL
ncbi:HNH endonuclease signature motif containing protein [Halorubrum ezzemoulense]|nr:HNH endonuclease signature motif containing protein [Halorubrum ezzemoulense]MDB9233798.1 HNH endonuclease signature motif containing protein [Halorubrum ezzemoulense]